MIQPNITPLFKNFPFQMLPLFDAIFARTELHDNNNQMTLLFPRTPLLQLGPEGRLWLPCPSGLESVTGTANSSHSSRSERQYLPTLTSWQYDSLISMVTGCSQ